jgi:hypothetical protein
MARRIANPNAGKLRPRDWEVLAIFFGFQNVDELQEFAANQHLKAVRRESGALR